MRRPTAVDSCDTVFRQPDDSLDFSSFGESAALLIDADEELIRTADIATLEADRSQREVERWRLEMSAQNQRFVNLRREKTRLLKELAQLERRLDKARALPVSPSTKTLLDVQSPGTCVVDGRHMKEDGFVVMPGTLALASKESVTAKEVELQYLMSRTIAALDAVQAEVTELRRHHAELCSRKGELDEDIKRLKATYQRQEQHKEELLQQKLFVKAAEADPSCRKALNERKEEEELISLAAECREALRQLRTERASMVAHLLEGAVQRERRTHHLRRTLGSSAGFGNHPLLSSLQEENTNLHAKYLQLVRSSEEEDAALVNYLDVLEERLALLQKAVVLSR